jgi:hypothetical protein
MLFQERFTDTHENRAAAWSGMLDGTIIKPLLEYSTGRDLLTGRSVNEYERAFTASIGALSLAGGVMSMWGSSMAILENSIAQGVPFNPVGRTLASGNPLGVTVQNNAATGRASKELGESLLELGPKPFPEAQAPHIVPTLGHIRSYEAVRGFVTAQEKIDIFLPGMRNHAINGFWDRVGHSGTHKDIYYRALGEEFRNVTSWESAVEALENMRFRILSGESK